MLTLKRMQQTTFDSHLRQDKKILEHTRVPIVTVAGSWKSEHEPQVLFSRAHYSMALAALMQEWQTGIEPEKAWLVDPTNYVSRHDWSKVVFTEEMGKAMARFSPLKALKDAIDSKVRSKLPITDAIHGPLVYLFENVHRPILSFHYEAGNILAGLGKKVVQVVTDPHVREQYLEFAQLHAIRFCVFDENTRISFLEKAALLGKKVDPARIIVTGPPVDPRIVAARKHKSETDHLHRPLRLCIATGGLGNNKIEIEQCLRSLAPALRRGGDLQVIMYCGVHEDIRESMHAIASQEGIPTANIHDTHAPLRVLFAPHIVEANELLIAHAFPWADGFVTKPSGDMAYDAAAAGCFILTLEPWGEWEENIREVFEQHSVSRRATPEKISEQIEALRKSTGEDSWTQQAIHNALHLPKLFTEGTKNILALMPKN
ncbi:MAG TPA: hypothetical protein VLH19_05040 [Patescibacteria group bacterium]|nr:hypothetical protein [Patescibacteria group bacterium]